jgi:hypothetical protein
MATLEVRGDSMVSARRFLTVLSLVGVLVLGSASAATAGKGDGGRGGGTLTLVMLDSTDGQAHYGQDVTFRVSTTATNKPLVQADCKQNGVLVYTHSAGFYPGYPWPWAQTFHLASAAWNDGAANCTAKLYASNGRGGFITLTTISFPVAA